METTPNVPRNPQPAGILHPEQGKKPNPAPKSTASTGTLAWYAAAFGGRAPDE